MPARAVRQSVATDPVSAAKMRCRAAHAAAKEADPMQSAFYDKLWAGVLLAADRQPEAAAVVMFTRIAILFEVAVDRLTWPERIRGLTTSAARPRARR